jgi:hypothetical protein
VDAQTGAHSLVALSENEEYLDSFRETVLAGRITGARIHDARVAALCLGHGVREILTADRDFSMFKRLKTRNPLVG